MIKEPRPNSASEWLVALLESPEDATLHEAFQGWVVQDPSHRQDWAEISNTYRLLGETIPIHVEDWADYAVQNPQSRSLPTVEAKVVPFMRRRSVQITQGILGVAMAACLGLFAFTGTFDRMRADSVTGTGELKRIELSDGSVVRLGPESALESTFSAVDRRVRLIDGMAYFDVTSDPDRPFVISAGDVTTMVVGTAFEVTMFDDAVVVSVREGRVRVERTGSVGAAEFLSAGDRLRVGGDGTQVLTRLKPDHVAAWLNGQFIANDTAVSDVVDVLSRYVEGPVVLYGDELARQPLTGVYNLSAAHSAIRSVADANGAELYQPSPWSVFIVE